MNDEMKYQRGVCDGCCETDAFVTSVEDANLCERCVQKAGISTLREGAMPTTHITTNGFEIISYRPNKLTVIHKGRTIIVQITRANDIEIEVWRRGAAHYEDSDAAVFFDAEKDDDE